MAKGPVRKSIVPPPANDPAVEEARLEILKRELAISRGLMVRARNGLEASRQATAAVRADLAAEQQTVRALRHRLTPARIRATLAGPGSDGAEDRKNAV